jgi:hypothetical protein
MITSKKRSGRAEVGRRITGHGLRITLLLALVIGHGLLVTSAPAQAPALINYQGRLLNGTNLVNGNVGLSLRLFNAASGGTTLYEDSNNVTVVDGLYSTYIGDNTTTGDLQSALANTQVWLQVVANGVALSPRERIASVAYALYAQNSGGLANGSITSAMLADGAVTANKIEQFANVPGAGALVKDPGLDFFGAFGFAIARADTRMMVGAPYQSDSFSSSGRAYLFEDDGSLVQAIPNPNPESSALFGYAMTSVSNDRVAVSAPGFGGAAGGVYVFNATGSVMATFNNPTPSVTPYLGSALCPLGNYAIAAATEPGYGVGGRIHLYTYEGVHFRSITNPVASTNSGFGGSLAAAGSQGQYLFVGAPHNDTPVLNAGIGYLFDDGGNLLTTFTNPAPMANDLFGWAAVGLPPNRIAISAIGAEDGAPDSGRVYVFDLSGQLLATVTNPSPTPNAWLGSSLALLDEQRFLVGEAGSNGAAGVVHVVDYNGVLQGSTPNPVPANNAFAERAMAVSSSSEVWVGAYLTIGQVFILQGATGSHAAVMSSGVRPGAITPDMLSFQVNDQFVHADGDTMTGPLRLPVNGLSVGSNQLAVAAGNVGVGVTNPAFLLDVNDRIRLRGSGTSTSAGLWLYDKTLGNDRAFVGLVDTNRLGLYSTITGFGLVMDLSTGNIGINTVTPTNRLHVNGLVQATGYITTSDRNAKENVQPADTGVILDKLAALPISTWTFKQEPSGTHIGPMAQDFHAAFGLGNTDAGIMTVDADGVALAAIQALAADGREQRSGFRVQQEQIKSLEAENEALKTRLDAIERKLGL